MNLKSLWPFYAPDTPAASAQETAAPRPASAPQSGSVSQSASVSLCAVFSSYSSVEAHIISGMLEDNGIKCVLSNELFAAADGPVANATGGVQVLVRASDADQARTLLNEAEAPEDAEAI